MRLRVFSDWYLPISRPRGGRVTALANLVTSLGDQLDISIVTRTTTWDRTRPTRASEPTNGTKPTAPRYSMPALFRCRRYGDWSTIQHWI